MNNKSLINILLCLDDIDGNYTRHCAVSIISLLETNKNNKIKIFILSSHLPEENINELKKIVNNYNQKIEFIIDKNIIPNELKETIINGKNLTRGARYRYFFPKYINGIDRILYIDCDVLIQKDISSIYNIDMHGKAISGYYDTIFANYKNKLYGTKNYINSGVLLFNVKKYNMNKINVKSMNKINDKYGRYFNGCDQDKINILYKDDIFVYKKGMNYLVENKYFNRGIYNAEVIHCLQKPYIQYNNVPQRIRKQYYKYLSLTKWKGYPEQKADFPYRKYIYNCFYLFFSRLLEYILPTNLMKRLINLIWFSTKYKGFS